MSQDFAHLVVVETECHGAAVSQTAAMDCLNHIVHVLDPKADLTFDHPLPLMEVANLFLGSVGQQNYDSAVPETADHYVLGFLGCYLPAEHQVAVLEFLCFHEVVSSHSGLHPWDSYSAVCEYFEDDQIGLKLQTGFVLFGFVALTYFLLDLTLAAVGDVTFQSDFAGVVTTQGEALQHFVVPLAMDPGLFVVVDQLKYVFVGLCDVVKQMIADDP